jgi:endonuclease/exonuclease/phosphatase family metal-dependent hydrolase
MNAPARSRRIRIVSYNVHGCVGLDGRFSPPRIAAVLADLDADFIALQELEDRPYAGDRVSRFLANRLGMTAHAGPTLKRGDADYGNLLLARHRAKTVRTHDLSVPGREPRGAIEANFDLAVGRLRMIATHLGLTAAERARQVRMLLAEFERDSADVGVLAGDFNEWRPIAATHRSLRGVFGRIARRKTFPTRAPMLALDRIYVTPSQIVTDVNAVTSREARIASDHLPLVSDLHGA